MIHRGQSGGTTSLEILFKILLQHPDILSSILFRELRNSCEMLDGHCHLPEDFPHFSWIIPDQLIGGFSGFSADSSGLIKGNYPGVFFRLPLAWLRGPKDNQRIRGVGGRGFILYFLMRISS